MINKLFVLLLLFFLVCKGYAQVLLDEEFLKMNNQPEMFFFEPHYDSNNKITHYTFGDFIKVFYTFDEQERPLLKNIFIWDAENFDWKKSSETTYRYENNRLLEERTRQILPYKKGLEVLDLNITTLLRTSVYDADHHTDSISITTYTPPIGYSSALSNTSYRIYYYNQYNLPDSVISWNQSIYQDMLYKEDYKYDNEKRPVSIEAFSRTNTDTDSWKHFSSTEIVYSKNSITYTQTIVYDHTELFGNLIDLGIDISEAIEDEELYHIIRDEANKENIPNWKERILSHLQAVGKHLQEVKTSFTILFDEHDRIREKTLEYDGKSMLNTLYSYDSLGRTSVTHEQSTEFRFPAYFDRIGLNMEDMPFLKYSIIYNDNCRKGVYYTKNIEDELIRRIEVENCFSPEGWVLSHSKRVYDRGNGEFEKQKRAEYEYYTEYGLSGERIEYETDLFDDKITDRVVQQILFLNDDEGRPLERFRFSFEDIDSVWIAKDRHVYRYDEYGYAILQEQYVPAYGDWKGKWSYEYSYDADKRILMKKEKVWREGIWENSTLSNYLYDERNNEKTLVEDYEWNRESQEWEGQRKYTACYNEEGENTEVVTYTWNEVEKEWTPGFKYETTLSSGEQTFEQRTVYQYDSSLQAWKPYFQLQKFAAEHIEVYLQWNEQENQWDNYARVVDKGGVNLYTYRWNSTAKDWKEIDFQKGITLREELYNLFTIKGVNGIF